MTTPEQLAKYREDFEKSLRAEDLVRDAQYPADYADIEIEANWIGYLRRCQETEQAIKDARKQALEEAIALCQYADFNDGNRTVTKKKLEELLND